MTIIWPKRTPGLDAWRAKYDAMGTPPLPDALSLPPKPYPETPSYDSRQRFCTDIPGGCPICDR